MEKVYKIKWPHKVTLTLDDHSITIKRKGAMNLLSHGLKGDKTIPLKNITAVQLKKPGVTNGYIQFSVLGGVEGTGGVFSATEDENTVMIASKKTFKNMEELKSVIEDYVYSDQKSSGTTINNPGEKSPAEQLKEFKELLDMEIITEEEFNKKKAELLG